VNHRTAKPLQQALFLKPGTVIVKVPMPRQPHVLVMTVAGAFIEADYSFSVFLYALTAAFSASVYSIAFSTPKPSSTVLANAAGFLHRKQLGICQRCSWRPAAGVTLQLPSPNPTNPTTLLNPPESQQIRPFS
jgi:hypothetical protein